MLAKFCQQQLQAVECGGDGSDPATGMWNVLSFDVEDYFQVSGFDPYIDRAQWSDFPSRLAPATERILELCERHRVKATFFVLGWAGERHPELVRRIAALGHEVGCHSYEHRLIYEQTPDQFREDLRRAKGVLEQLAGTPVTAYRAPSFSITRQSVWALDILRQEGFLTDSSIYPVRHDRYGMASAPRFPHRIETRHGDLWEFPPSYMQYCRLRLPVGGGGYFRLYPYRVTARGIRQIHRQGRPAMCWFHPWEFDPDQPRIPKVKWSVRFRHYVGLASTYGKLDRLLSEFRFSPLREVARTAVAPVTYSC
jgi:polysaccharide deacetylase family protein (PEP-CTERM system associated)